MKVDQFNLWRWILLISALILSAFFSVLLGFEVWDDIFAVILLLIIFSIIIAFTILLLVNMNTVARRIKIALFIVFGAGIPFWFASKLQIYESEFATYIKWTFEVFGMFLLIGGLFLLFICYLNQTRITIPLLISIIIAGLVLNRFGASSVAEFLIFQGYFLLTIGLLKEAISALKQFRKQVFMKRLFFIICILLCICSGILFVQYTSYEVVRLGTYDLIEVIAFLLACLYLFIAMPFSDFLEWMQKTKVHFYRIILIPVVFLFLTVSLRFVLPIETYKRVFFKEHSKTTINFGMKDYKLKVDPDKDTY